MTSVALRLEAVLDDTHHATCAAAFRAVADADVVCDEDLRLGSDEAIGEILIAPSPAHASAFILFDYEPLPPLRRERRQVAMEGETP